jgi:hypothetical protein
MSNTAREEKIHNRQTEIQKQSDTKKIFAKVAKEFGAKVSKWEHSSLTTGLWDYVDMQLRETSIRVGTSGGGVISIDGKPHDLDGRVIDNEDSARSALVAAILKKQSIFEHPKTYADVIKLDSVAETYGDVLDAMFLGRVSALRKEMLALGWEHKSVDFLKGEDRLHGVVVHHESNTKKTIGCQWHANDYKAEPIVDDFSQSPKQLAEMLIAACQKPSCSEDEHLEAGCRTS